MYNIQSSFILSEVARLYGCSRQAISNRAARLRKERGIFGFRRGHSWFFTPDDVADLKPGPRGRPRKKDSAAQK